MLRFVHNMHVLVLDLRIQVNPVTVDSPSCLQITTTAFLRENGRARGDERAYGGRGGCLDSRCGYAINFGSMVVLTSQAGLRPQ